MFKKVRSRLSFSNVVAVIALFVALGGTSYAALRVGSKQIINNSIRSKDLRNGQVRTRDLKNSDVRTQDIRNNHVRSRDLRDGDVGTQDLADNGVGTQDLADNDIRNADANAELALAKGFASVDARNTNGPATVHNFGGQQTSTAPTGVSAERVAQGIYDVTFVSNDGKFTDVDSVNDLTTQVTGRNGFSTGSIFDAASSASADQVKLRVFMRRPDNGGTIDSDFSIQFYARTTP